MEKVLSQSEKTILARFLPQMECATKHGYYTAIPSTDMKMLQDIYKRHINHAHTPRLWCSACCMMVLRGLYELAKKATYGNGI